MNEKRRPITGQVPISALLSGAIELTERNKGHYRAKCPFCHEKDSLGVSSDRGIYKCYTCDAGGDAVNFFQEFYDLSYLDAYEEVLKIHDRKLALQETIDRKLNKRVKHRERVLRAHNEAAMLSENLFSTWGLRSFEVKDNYKDHEVLKLRNLMRKISKREDVSSLLDDLNKYNNRVGSEQVKHKLMVYAEAFNLLPNGEENSINEKLAGLSNSLGGFEVSAPNSDIDFYKGCIRTGEIGLLHLFLKHKKIGEFMPVFLYGPDENSFVSIIKVQDDVVLTEKFEKLGWQRHIEPSEYHIAGRLQDLVADHLRLKQQFESEELIERYSPKSLLLKQFEWRFKD